MTKTLLGPAAADVHAEYPCFRGPAVEQANPAGAAYAKHYRLSLAWYCFRNFATFGATTTWQ